MKTERANMLRLVGSYLSPQDAARISDALDALGDACMIASRNNGNLAYQEKLRTLGRSFDRDRSALREGEPS